MTCLNSARMIEQCELFGAHNYAPLDVVLTRGEGIYVWDVEGNRYVDFLSAYSALNQGHCHPKIIRALIEQSQRLTLTSRAFYNDRMGMLLEKLCRLSAYEMALLMNSGVEAVETSVKLMRRYAHEKRNLSCDEGILLVAEGNFHGRTIAAVSMSSDPTSYGGYGPYTPGFVKVPFGDISALEAQISPKVIGVLLEPIQGEAGVIIPPAGYLTDVRALCDKHDMLFALDEIQTGLGRTGKLFAWQHDAVFGNTRPDIVMLGKALSGGVYPVSCVLADRRLLEVFTPGTHGSTYGGNPLGAAVALAALRVLEEEHLIENAERLGKIALSVLRNGLTGPNLKEVRGKGLMLAVEFHTPCAHEAVISLRKIGVLAKDTHSRTIRLAPPLVISEAQLREVLPSIIEVLNPFAQDSAR